MNLVKKLSDNSKDYLNTYYEIIDSMQKNMQEATTENCSISDLFIKQYIPFSTALVNLSNNILRYTTNYDIENLAKQITDEQSSNISKINDMIPTCSCFQNSDRDMNLYVRKFNDNLTFTTNALNTLPANNNLNSHYLHSLIIHHEGGINFAKNALHFPLCNNLKAFLNEVVIKNTAQIALIKQLLRNA